ncbi:hypothetical protein PR003_g15595 [Phytophthora rubi]|nr:hypothetical protein PR003_g15595 [Phytophthora rubi]
METPNMPAMAHSFTGAQYAQRMLRTVDDDEDERGLTDKLSGILENVATKSELKSLLKKGTSTDDMLDKLKLNTGVVNILENPTFKRLDDYVAMYKDAFPHSGVTMVGTLTARYGDDAVARALEAGKKSIATEEMAKKLQEVTKISHAVESFLVLLFSTALRSRHASTKLAKLVGANWDDTARKAANGLQHKQFKVWSRNDVTPEGVLTSVFKLKTPTEATAADNMIVDKYRAWLNRRKRTHS